MRVSVQWPLIGASLISFGLLSGCAPVRVNVTTYLANGRDFPSPGTSAPIAIAVATPGDRQLLEAEVAEKAARLLRERGFDVGPAARAGYLLTCDFDMDAGREVARTVARQRPPVEYRSYYTRRGRTYRVESLMVPARTTYHTEHYTVYGKWLRMKLLALDPAQDPAKALRGDVLWQCDARCVGTSADLRWLINHLLIAGFDYFGEDTGRALSVSLGWDDDRVKALAAGDGPLE